MGEVTHIEAWHDLYVMLGTSAAALIGLLFVATSLHLVDMGDNPVFRTRSRNVTLHLVAMLVQATVILTPQSLSVLGLEIIIINLCGLYLPVSFAFRVFVQDRPRRGQRSDFSVYRWMSYVLGYAVGIAGGAALSRSQIWGLYLVTLSNVDFFVSVIWDAWKLMMGVRQQARKKVRKA